MDRHERSGIQEQMASPNSPSDGYKNGLYKYSKGYSYSQTPNSQDEGITPSQRSSWMTSRKFRNWALSALVSLALVLSAWPSALRTQASDIPNLATAASSDPPRQSTNFSTVVQWDNYSLFLNDQRIFLQYVICHHRRSINPKVLTIMPPQFR